MFKIRNISPGDYHKIIPVMNEWWGGRKMSDMLPKLFFIHFKDTSFVIEDEDDVLCGFLCGFVSQTYRNEAYVHFIGVNPDYRRNGIGYRLYNRFFETVHNKGVNIIRAVTSPVNKASIKFHKNLGFELEEGNGLEDNIPVFKEYDGEGQSRVLFIKKLEL